jgi:hypothetical protein
MTTTTTVLLATGCALSMILAGGCEESRDGVDETAEAPQGVEAAPIADGDQALEPSAPQAVDAATLELERILRRVERGNASDGDAAALSTIVTAGKLPADALDSASLALSTLLEEDDDLEGAIRTVEELMKRHAGDPAYAAHEAAERRLRLLLTGNEEAPRSTRRNMEPMAEVAKVLARFFPEDERKVSLLDVVSVGTAPTAGDPHGILNLSRAKRELAEEACAVCEVDIKAQRSHSRIESWVDLPLAQGEHRADMPNPDRSMVVVYFDLTENRVPSRYDAYLAVPSAETVERLERGEAFVAVRERPGKKPLILLAAPRAGQLDLVETAFAEMRGLPVAPHPVEVPKKLQPHEIQGVVRGGFRNFRVCYEKLLAADPTAAGKVVLKFRIDGAGQPQDVTTDSTFADATIGSCVAEHMGSLRFPASGEKVTVTYPIAFSP